MNSVQMQLFYESNDEDRCWDEAFIKSVISEKGNCDVMILCEKNRTKRFLWF